MHGVISDINVACLYMLQDLCRKCIKHNASCGKAWERLGSILEREQAYKVSLACAYMQLSHVLRHLCKFLHSKWQC